MKIITADDAKKLLKTIPTRAPFGSRDRGIIIFLLHTGLRVSELCALNVGQVWSYTGHPRQIIRVRGKGGKMRNVELNQTAQKAIRLLIDFNEERGFSIEPKAPLLVNRKHRRLGARAVQYMFRKWCEKAGLDIPATPHSARHGFATALLEKSVPTRTVQDLLGHSRLSSTQVYTHSTSSSRREAVERLDN